MDKPDIELSFLIDAHEDIAYNWLEHGRYPGDSALSSRESESSRKIPATVGSRTTGLPEWIAGRVAIVLATLFVLPERFAQREWKSSSQRYSNIDEAHDRASHQLDKYRELANREAQISLVTNRDELEQVVSTWTSHETTPTVGLVISMEGADPIRKPAEIEDWYARGLRSVGPSWVATRYAGGTHEAGPLTRLGRELLAEMAQLNMILDLSHMAESACYQAIDFYPGPIIASHSNPRKFLPTDRGLSDKMILQLAERGGVVGIMPINGFLMPDWKAKSDVKIDLVVSAIEHVAQLTGSSEHVALGSDFDGGFGAENIPAGMDSVADLRLIGAALGNAGYRQSDIENIMHHNWLRILRAGLP